MAKKQAPLEKTVETKLTAYHHKKFKSVCKKKGISMSEALRQAIRDFIN